MSSSPAFGKKELIEWANAIAQLPQYSLGKVTDITKSFFDGRLFLAIADFYEPEMLKKKSSNGNGFKDFQFSTSAVDRIKNIETAFDIFEKLGVPRHLDAEDCGKEPLSMQTYMFPLYRVFHGANYRDKNWEIGSAFTARSDNSNSLQRQNSAKSGESMQDLFVHAEELLKKRKEKQRQASVAEEASAPAAPAPVISPNASPSKPKLTLANRPKREGHGREKTAADAVKQSLAAMEKQSAEERSVDAPRGTSSSSQSSSSVVAPSTSVVQTSPVKKELPVASPVKPVVAPVSPSPSPQLVEKTKQQEEMLTAKPAAASKLQAFLSAQRQKTDQQAQPQAQQQQPAQSPKAAPPALPPRSPSAQTAASAVAATPATAVAPATVNPGKVDDSEAAAIKAKYEAQIKDVLKQQEALLQREKQRADTLATQVADREKQLKKDAEQYQQQIARLEKELKSAQQQLKESSSSAASASTTAKQQQKEHDDAKKQLQAERSANEKNSAKVKELHQELASEKKVSAELKSKLDKAQRELREQAKAASAPSSPISSPMKANQGKQPKVIEELIKQQEQAIKTLEAQLEKYSKGEVPASPATATLSRSPSAAAGSASIASAKSLFQKYRSMIIMASCAAVSTCLVLVPLLRYRSK